MDKITATKVYEKELREMEFIRIEKIIDGYSISYKPEKQFLFGTIFKFDHNSYSIFHGRYYIVTFVTDDKIYYRRLYAQIYHPTWESKQYSQNYDETYFMNSTTRYVFKYNENLIGKYAKDSFPIDYFYKNTICFRSSEIYEIIADYKLCEIEKIENNIEL